MRRYVEIGNSGFRINAMADLINTFSWSISARADFEECPRRMGIYKIQKVIET